MTLNGLEAMTTPSGQGQHQDSTQESQDVRATLPKVGLTQSLLQDYHANLDPLNSSDLIAAIDNTKNQDAVPVASPSVPVAYELATAATASSPPRLVSSHRSFLQQTLKSPSSPIGSHRSMLRSLASRSSQESLRPDRAKNDVTRPGAVLASRLLHTPCFFHQRFEDAVNADRVLEEIAAEEDGISHSRLMQTATSVRKISKQLQRRPIKRAVRSVMIVTKARDNKLVFLTRDLAEWLLKTPQNNSELGVVVYVDAKLRNSKRFDAAGLVAPDTRLQSMLRYWTPDMCTSAPEKFDLVLTLGGDGTVLYTSWLFQRVVPPILSFSLGTLGFLTNFAFADYKRSLRGVMAGMRVNMRMRFTCTIYRSQASHLSSSRASSSTNLSSSIPGSHDQTHSTTSSASSNLQSTLPSSSSTSTTSSYPPPPHPTNSLEPIPERTFEVLNELVLDRGPSPYVSNLERYGDTHLLTIIQADGIIISTPTGSTAYSLSAGGPLTHPSIPGILLTPICPHTLSFRPMVLSDTLMLRLVVPRHSRGGAYASFDGKGRVELRRGDEVRVEVGRYPFPTVVGEGGTGGEWFDSVRRALRWNTRGAVQGGFARRVGGTTEEEDSRIEEEREWKAQGDGDVDGTEELEEPPEEEWDIDAEPLEGDEWPGSGTASAKGGNSEAASLATSPVIKGTGPLAID